MFFKKAAPMFAAIRAELDTGPPNLTGLVVTLDGQVLKRSTDPYDDRTPGTHYAPLSDYQLPAHTKILARDELVEVSRLSAFADIVVPASASPTSQERLVFKYYLQVFDLQSTWNAINIGARVSDHPHIAPVRHVVVDESDRSRVVGFTAPFYPGGNLEQTKHSRVFKLKWAKQLFRTVDDLHLKYGVTHWDLHTENVVIDPETDNLILIDFGCASKIGTPEFTKHHMAALEPRGPDHPLHGVVDDIKAAIRMVHSLVTDLDDNSWTDPPMIKKGGWVKGPDVRLDSPVEDYYRLVMDWLRERNSRLRITQHNQASEPLNYPDYMPPPQVDIDVYEKIQKKKKAEEEGALPDRLVRFREAGCNIDDQIQQHQADVEEKKKAKEKKKAEEQPVVIRDEELLEDIDLRGFELDYMVWWSDAVPRGFPRATGGRHFMRRYALEAGGPFGPLLSWERPSTAQLDRTRRLLATGKYEDVQPAGADTDENPNTRKRKAGGEAAAAAEEEEEGERDGADDGGGGKTTGKASVTDNTTGRVTRSAKKGRFAAPPVLKPESKPKPTRKAAAPKKAAAKKAASKKAAATTSA